MAETPAAAANPSVDKQPPSDTRTLDDYKQGESFYKQLCGDKDEEIRALKEQVEVKKTVIDHLRAELLAVQKAAANPNSRRSKCLRQQQRRRSARVAARRWNSPTKNRSEDKGGGGVTVRHQ